MVQCRKIDTQLSAGAEVSEVANGERLIQLNFACLALRPFEKGNSCSGIQYGIAETLPETGFEIIGEIQQTSWRIRVGETVGYDLPEADCRAMFTMHPDELE
jgi:hypothetical protein